MKKVIALISALLVFLSIPLTAFGNKISIDGVVSDNREWELGEYPQDEYLILENDTNNKSKYISVKCFLNNNGRTVYYLINTDISDYNPLDAVIYAVPEGCNKINFALTESKTESNVGTTEIDLKENTVKYKDKTTDYTIYAVAKFGEYGLVTVEMQVDYNNGYGNNANISVQTTDSDNQSSYVENFSFKTPNNPDYWANRTTPVTEITTKKTTTTKTTKDTYSTKKRTEKTHRVDNVKKRTTTKKITTSKVKKTTTTAKVPKATKSKTTKAVKSTRKAYTKVIKEKEIYIVEATASSATTLQTVTEAVNTETQTEKSAFSFGNISRSTIYKIITGICALLLFGVIGVWAVKSKDDNDNNNEEKTDE